MRNVADSIDATVERLNDPGERARAERHLQRLRRRSYWGFVCVFVNTAYFAYRMKCSLDGLSRLFLSEVMITWVFLGLEFAFAFPSYLNYLMAISRLRELRIRPFLRLVGDEVPIVDVLITCCGESLDVILDTVRAACAMDYPKERFRVVLLDDGNSAALKKRIDVLHQTHGNLLYTARGVELQTHSKAANLNHGLSFVKRLETESSEYVAVLDVDMIPMRDLLRALLPHLLNDQTVAMATAPQHFYNIPDGDPLYQGPHSFIDFFLLLQDITDNTYCTGTGFVVRRSAVDQIGGIPTDQMTEDAMTTLLLCDKGWKIAYVWEPLQWGLVPNGFACHAKQQSRWAKGFTSIVFILLGSRLENIGLGRRVSSAVSLLAMAGTAVALTCAMLFVPIILIAGKPFIAVDNPEQLRNLLMMSALQLLVTWLNGLITAEATGFRTPIWPPYRQTFLAPFQSVSLLGFSFPFTQNFTPTGSTDDGNQDSEDQASQSFASRLKFALGDYSSWLQLFVITSSTLGARYQVKMALSMDTNSQLKLQRLFVGAAWPPALVHWMLFVQEGWKLISNTLFPSETYSREALLIRDPGTKIAYPSDMAKDGKRIRPSQRYPFVVLAYAVFVLACSWGLSFE